MSRATRSRAKRAWRQRRAGRHWRTLWHFDIETRGACTFRGDYHIGQGNEQIMTYARLGGLTEFMVLNGGDLVHPECSK